ncbi:ABC transporter permease [Marinibaculum pumilum]|uniref:ABC transporter permease n=1 Tax=Marinibaculum pumilum TaxID=1766165 RepID=A0ABV7KXK2_9PROT
MRALALLVGRRLLYGAVTLLAVSFLIFGGTELLPGDVAEAILGQGATPEAVAAIRADLDLDRPAWERYADWLGGILSGDLGTSLTSKRPIDEMIGARLGNTLTLAAVAAIVSVPLALLLGLLAALYRNTIFDRVLSVGTVSTVSMPEFFVGYLLILVFAILLGWLPPNSNAVANPQLGLWDQLVALALPCATLTVVVVAHMMRMTRAAVINILTAPFIEMATLKGVSRARRVFRHAFPNALSPIINVVVLNLAYLVVGVVVVEVVFVYPGMGQLMVDHVAKRDVPVVQACAMIFAATYVLLNMSADILAILANPRLRHPK